MGCGAFVLGASEMGYPVYVKMGFAPVCTMRTYEPGDAGEPRGRTPGSAC
jgi:hypothetical protein